MKSRHFLIAMVAIPAIMSFLAASLYLTKPSIFYFRGWEFFDDTVFTGFGATNYVFYETGDAGREYLIQRYGSFNAITINELGNRIGCYDAEKKQPGILMLGDSQLWGSGNTDEDTLPQVLCRKYNANIYNGSRLHEFNLLRVKEYNFSKIIFTSAERVHITRYCTLLNEYAKVEDHKLQKKDLFLKKQWLQFIYRNIKHFGGYLKSRVSVVFDPTKPIHAPVEDLIIARHSTKSGDLEDDLRCARRLRDFFSARNIDTAFIYFPAQQTILAKKLGLNLDSITYNFIPNAYEKMSTLKIKSLDTRACLLRDEGWVTVTQPHDTHLSKQGIASMAQCIDESNLKFFMSR